MFEYSYVDATIQPGRYLNNNQSVEQWTRIQSNLDKWKQNNQLVSDDATKFILVRMNLNMWTVNGKNTEDTLHVNMQIFI